MIALDRQLSIISLLLAPAFRRAMADAHPNGMPCRTRTSLAYLRTVSRSKSAAAGALRVILVRDRRAEQRVHKWIRRNREEERAGLKAISGESRSGDPSEHRDADCDHSADQLYDSLDRYGWTPCRCPTASRCLQS
jgi:hypothetical protein